MAVCLASFLKRMVALECLLGNCCQLVNAVLNDELLLFIFSFVWA